jgi:hypothetical protein
MFKDRRNLTRFFPLKKVGMCMWKTAVLFSRPHLRPLDTLQPSPVVLSPTPPPPPPRLLTQTPLSPPPPPPAQSLIIERKNIELKSKNEMDVLAGRVGSVETTLAKLSVAVERLAESQAGMNAKMVQEQHQLAGGVGEVVEAIKALQQQWQLGQQQQQQQQQQHATTTAQRTFLSKVTMAQRERERQRGKQPRQPEAEGSSGGGGGSGESPPRSTSPHWRAARTGLAKAAVAAAATRLQEQGDEGKEGGGGGEK